MTAPVSSIQSTARSRRALLAGALGGLSAWAASAVGRASPVRAADGETVVVGGLFTATSETRLTNITNTETVLSGVSNDNGVGVRGHSLGHYGVHGTSGSGRGVYGWSPGGVGLFGESGVSTGLALQTVGRVKFSTSGVATIAAGSTGRTVNPGVNVTSGSFVLLTPRTSIGSRALWFTTDASANTFRIRMSSSRSTNTPVAWLLLG